MIEDYKDIFVKKECRMEIIKEEFFEIKEKFGDECCLVIEYVGGDVSIIDLIVDEKVVIIILYVGYIKRILFIEYKI